MDSNKLNNTLSIYYNKINDLILNTTKKLSKNINYEMVYLKLSKLTHQDIGQIDFYVWYFDNEIKSLDDKPTIRIILCTDKKDTIVKYSVLNDNKHLFASKYQLYLPTKEELINEIEKAIIIYEKQ